MEAFPRYFALGHSYSPLRGYIRCDDENQSFLVVPAGSGECPVPLTYADCLKRVEVSRLAEVTQANIDQMNALWDAHRDVPLPIEKRYP